MAGLTVSSIDQPWSLWRRRERKGNHLITFGQALPRSGALPDISSSGRDTES
jgi:hypothetical protein